MRNVGPRVAEALPSLHAFMGCDSTSAFAGKGKLAALRLLKSEPEYQDLFKSFGSSWEVSEEMFKKLEGFKCQLYK